MNLNPGQRLQGLLFMALLQVSRPSPLIRAAADIAIGRPAARDRDDGQRPHPQHIPLRRRRRRQRLRPLLRGHPDGVRARRPPPPEPARQQRQQHRGVDGDDADALLAEAPAVDVDDGGGAPQGLHGADEGGRDHEQPGEQERGHAELAGPGDAEAEDEGRRDAHDGEVGDDVEDGEGPEVLGPERALRPREGVDLPVEVVARVPGSDWFSLSRGSCGGYLRPTAQRDGQCQGHIS